MEAPRRFWHVTLFTADGREIRRYVKCPYLNDGGSYKRPIAPGDPDYPDTHAAMTSRLGSLEWDGILSSYRVSPVPAERIAAVRNRAVRWREVEDFILGKVA